MYLSFCFQMIFEWEQSFQIEQYLGDITKLV